MALNEQKTRFCHEFVDGFNGTKAAIKAGYTETSARARASELRKEPEVAKLIEELTSEHLERLGITKERVLREMSAIAFSDPREILTSGGNLADPSEWSDKMAAAVCSYEIVNTGRPSSGDTEVPIEYTHRVKMWNKTTALEQIAKHLGIVNENVNHTGGIIVTIGDKDAAGL